MPLNNLATIAQHLKDACDSVDNRPNSSTQPLMRAHTILFQFLLNLGGPDADRNEDWKLEVRSLFMGATYPKVNISAQDFDKATTTHIRELLRACPLEDKGSLRKFEAEMDAVNKAFGKLKKELGLA